MKGSDSRERSSLRWYRFPHFVEFTIGPAEGRTRWLHAGYEPLNNHAAIDLPVTSFAALGALRRSLGCRRFLGGLFRWLLGRRSCGLGWGLDRLCGFSRAWPCRLRRLRLKRRVPCRLFLR